MFGSLRVLSFEKIVILHEAGTFYVPVIAAGFVVKNVLVGESFSTCFHNSFSVFLPQPALDLYVSLTGCHISNYLLSEIFFPNFLGFRTGIPCWKSRLVTQLIP